jgi:hypothetical protein
MIDDGADLTIEEAGVLREMIYEAQLESEARRERGEPMPDDTATM